MTPLQRGALTALLGSLVWATPMLASAGNTVHPRTPVVWPDMPCIGTVDRSLATTFAFTYTIPIEDTDLSIDEFADSRTHQFIGFCRQWPAGRPPPRYISLADLERAVEAGFEEPAALADVESTLETSAAWAGCWTRITADDERRPITHAAASEPVTWELSTIAAGTWMIAGYTWEPPYNLWSRAPWVLRVLDETMPVDPPQAAATIADTPDNVAHDGALDLALCVDASPGATLTLEWAASKPDVLAWSELTQRELDGPGELTLTFEPPMDSWGASVVLRAVVDQPAGASYEAHGLSTVIVFAPSGDGDGDGSPGDGDGSPGDGDGSPGDGDGEAGTTAGESGDTGAPADAGQDSSGCDCSTTDDRGNLIGLALAWFGLLRARRRRPPCCHDLSVPSV